MNKKLYKILAICLGLLVVVSSIVVYNKYSSPTKIAFANYPEYILASSLDQEINPKIEVSAIAWNEKSGEELKNYDMVIFFGMGLNFTPEQQELIAKSTVPMYTTASTRSETALNTLTNEQYATIGEYLSKGGKDNFRNMLNYIRSEVDGKKFGVEAYEPAVTVKSYTYLHPEYEGGFDTYEEYLAWYQNSSFYTPDGAEIVIFSGNSGGSQDLVSAMESRGMNAVLISGMGRQLTTVEALDPDLVVFFPHGRLSVGGEGAVEYFTRKNIPVYAPIRVNQLYDEYLHDQMGMEGGMLSQSVTMPELDGAVVPYVLTALFVNDRGFQESRMIPERVERFSEMVKKVTDLKRIPNSEKKLAIIYYKGAGKNALSAGSLEVGDSILNTLKNLQSAGYTTGDLPETPAELIDQIQNNAVVFGNYAEGAMHNFMQRAATVTITSEEYAAWIKKAMPDDLYADVVANYGEFPGKFFATPEGDMALGVVRFGNIIMMPQSLPAEGPDENAIIHGAKVSPTHTYIATYLYLRYGFEADALMHFGTHGSLEFTPWKQVALSQYDWPEVLIGEVPHYYLYVINNVGEALLAKRRTYATMVSHLTAPFMTSGTYGALSDLHERFHFYEEAVTNGNKELQAEYAKTIIATSIEENYHIDLNLSEDFTNGILNDEDLQRVHNYLHEIENAKVNRGLYVIGRSYSDDEASETAKLMSIDAIATDMFNADVTAGKVKRTARDDSHFYEEHYLEPIAERLEYALANPDEFASVEVKSPASAPAGMGEGMSSSDMQKMMESGKLPDCREMPAEMMAGMAAMMGNQPQSAPRGRLAQTTEEVKLTPEQVVLDAKKSLVMSTQAELDAMVNAFNGGYLVPSPGGDPILNPATVPTGRNLYGNDPERTPTKESYNVGAMLADQLIAEKLKTTGEYPKKVAFSLWGGEFIRTQGVNIGQIFYLLGVEPIWDSRGRVLDVRLIPMSELQRPRIDVVLQTSQQFRSAATSRVFLIDKAVRLAAADPDGEFGNFVRAGSLEMVKGLIATGMSPEEAKKLADVRVFGSGSTGMVESGDKWDDQAELAEHYIRSNGSIYTEERWGERVPDAFRYALVNTDTVVQSRSNNSWGPLSLDHVYEFTGGISMASNLVNGFDPDAYFNDLRNPGQAKFQSVGEAAMVEARSTVLNPKYIKEMQEEGPSAAGHFAEIFRNTYGWEVTKPDMLQDHLWKEYKEVYIDDKLDLNMREYFEEKNPYALQEMTAVMLETIRKGLWEADAETIKQIAEVHAELVKDFEAGCSGFVCDNAKLREFIQENLSSEELSQEYLDAIDEVLNPKVENTEQKPEEVTGQTLKEEKITPDDENVTVKALWIVISIVCAGIVIMLIGGRKKKL